MSPIHPNITEQIPQTNYAPQYTDDKPNSQQISQQQVFLTDASTINIKSNSLYNVQPTSHNAEPRIFFFPSNYKKISILSKNSTLSCLSSHIQSMLLFVTYWSNRKFVMLLKKRYRNDFYSVSFSP